MDRYGLAVLLCIGLLPLRAHAAPSRPGAPQAGLLSGRTNIGAVALLPALAPAIGDLPTAGWGSAATLPAWHALTRTNAADDDPALPDFGVGGFDALWDDETFSEMSAYGGLARDALRVAAMRAIDGTDGASQAIPYGRLTLARAFFDGRQQLVLGAYGTQVSVRPTAISGFGDDSYTDVAVDGSWRWQPGKGLPGTISAHVLVLHEDENLLASQAVLGTNREDDLSVFRGGASWSWGSGMSPSAQYFRVTGSADPVRVETLEGSPDSQGFIAGISYQPADDLRTPLDWFDARLSLQFVAYSEFDGSSHNAAHNNAVLIHLSAGADSGP